MEFFFCYFSKWEYKKYICNTLPFTVVEVNPTMITSAADKPGNVKKVHSHFSLLWITSLYIYTTICTAPTLLSWHNKHASTKNTSHFVILSKVLCLSLSSLATTGDCQWTRSHGKEAADGVNDLTADEMLIAKMERICGRCRADWSVKIKL